MKKTYMKPMVEIETYALSASIAANCSSVISLGPEAPGYEVCKDYEGSFDVMGIESGFSTMSTGGIPFYSDGAADCTCYYSSGGGIYFTS